MSDVTAKLNEVKKIAAAAKAAGTARTGGNSTNKQDTAYIKEATDLYRRLTQTQLEYIKASKAGHNQEAAYWTAQRKEVNDSLTGLREKRDQLGLQEAAYKKLTQILSDAEEKSKTKR